MKYRAEIDGLRAIALLSIIFFHAGFEAFKGGFVGVDVFLVISGYLFTATTLPDIERGSFLLTCFYERRARRLIPALFLVMLVTLTCAWFWLPPPEMKDFSQSLIAVSYFASNILFWLQSGYWSVASELKPLLHTWTLAIEAQYYLLLPIILILIRKFNRFWKLSFFLLILGLSFGISRWASYNFPSANFFLLPTRAWEIALGAIFAILMYQKDESDSRLLSSTLTEESLGLLGLLLIGYSVFTLDETFPFPGLYTLIPTVGTGLVILFGSSGTLVNRLLSTKLLLGIGIISYSAYLWHQPLLVFARHRTLTEPSKPLIVALICLVFPLAYLSWKYIEKPFRNDQKVSRKAIFLLWLIGSIAFIEIGVAGHITNGFERRLPKKQPIVSEIGEMQLSSIGETITRDSIKQVQINSVEQTLSLYFPESRPPAFMEQGGQYQRQYYIEQGNYGLSTICDGAFTLSLRCRTSSTPEILVWGDSFAMHLVPGIMASNPNAKIIQMTKSVCGPFFDVSPIAEPEFPPRWARECLEFTGNVREWVKKSDSVKYAVLSSPFINYLLKDEILMLRNGEHVKADTALAFQEFEKTLIELVSRGIKPVIFSPPPANNIDLGQCLSRASWMGIAWSECNFSKEDLSQPRLAVYRFLDLFKEDFKVIQLQDLMCDDAICKTHLGSIPLYGDIDHLTREGSAALGKQYDFYSMIVGD